MPLRSTSVVTKTVIIALGLLYTAPSLAQPSATTSGTLTCTVADVPKKASALIDLSCNLKSQSGAVSDYVGQAGTKTGGFPPAKFVFVWTVAAVGAAGEEASLDERHQPGRRERDLQV